MADKNTPNFLRDVEELEEKVYRGENPRGVIVSNHEPSQCLIGKVTGVVYGAGQTVITVTSDLGTTSWRARTSYAGWETRDQGFAIRNDDSTITIV